MNFFLKNYKGNVFICLNFIKKKKTLKLNEDILELNINILEVMKSHQKSSVKIKSFIKQLVRALIENLNYNNIFYCKASWGIWVNRRGFAIYTSQEDMGPKEEIKLYHIIKKLNLKSGFALAPAIPSINIK